MQIHKVQQGISNDSTFTVYDNADNTKILAVETSGITTGNTRTLTAPDFDGTIGTLAGTETLTNKTITSAVLNTGVSGTAILDEDAMGTDSDTQLATQQSIKAYVDSQSTAGDFDDSTFTVYDNADNTKILAVETSGITTGTTRTLTAPDFDGTIGTLAGTETLTNKTLTTPSITSGVLNIGVSGTAILDEDAMGTDSDTQLATQQSIKAYVDSQSTAGDFDDSTFTVYDNADNTKILAVETSGITTGTTRTLTAPDFDGTIGTLAGTETLTNKTLTSPIISSPTITSGVLNTGVSGTAILDEDAMGTDSATQLATQQSIKAYVDSQSTAGDFDDSTFTVYDNADNTKILAVETSGITTGTTRTLTAPDFDGTIGTLAGTETLTNKTLSSPVISTPTITSGVLNTDVSGTAILDEDAMGTDSATQLATQQSIKAYVDSQVRRVILMTVPSLFTIMPTIQKFSQQKRLALQPVRLVL